MMSSKYLFAFSAFAVIAMFTAPVDAQSGSRGGGGFPAPSFQSAPSLPLQGSATRNAPSLPQPSFAQPSGGFGGSSTVNLPPQPVVSQPSGGFVQGSGTRNPAPTFSTPSQPVFSQSQFGSSAPIQSGAPIYQPSYQPSCGPSYYAPQSVYRQNYYRPSYYRQGYSGFQGRSRCFGGRCGF